MSEPIHTERLLLRKWREADIEPFARLNADPRVMEYLPGPLNQSESQEFADRIQEHFDQYGYGLYALERREDTAFIGFTGLNWAAFEEHFTPALEVGWRLAREFWGQGYATEAARACLTYAFRETDVPEVVSFTVPANTRSAAVMKRLGMTRKPADDFIHPKFGSDHALGPHILFRIDRQGWPTPE